MRMPRPLRTGVSWGFNHGVPMVVFRRQAKTGNPTARLSVEPELLDDPSPVWEEIRARGPWVRGDFVSWTATHAVGSAVLRSDAFGVPIGEGLGPAFLSRLMDAAYDPWAVGPIDPPSLLALDPPDHTRLRRLIAKSFTARRVREMEPRVQATADRLLDRLEELPGRRADLVAAYASQLPVAVIADLLGVHEADRPRVLAWGNAAALLLDAGLSWRTYRGAISGVRELHVFMDEHIETLRRRPGDDLLSQVIAQADELPADERPTRLELRQLGLLVLGAGFETTVNLLGNAVAQLSAHPDERVRLADDPDLWPTAVEEVLRFDSPVQFSARKALRPIDLHDLPGLRDLDGLPEGEVPAGSFVLVMNGALNRDPDVFSDPNRFDVGRANAADHLAFSAGAHFCLGAGLARTEGVIGLRSLYDRFPELAVDGAPVRRDTRVLRGYEELPVRW